MKRRNPRITVAAILGILGAILSIPVVDYLRDYLQGREDRFLYPLGFESGITGTPFGWVLSLLVAAAFILFTIKNIPAVAETWRELSFLKVISIYLAIVAAIVEEAFFRRVVMDMVAEAEGAVWIQIAASATAFGVAHAFWGLIKLSLGAALKTTIATGIMGFALAIVYVVSDRSLAPCIVSHFLITATLEPGLMMAAVTGQWSRRTVRV